MDTPQNPNPSSLKNWREKIPKPPETANENLPPPLPKKDKETGKGCLIGFLSLVGIVVLHAYWRQILLMVGFFGPWALVAFLGIRAKKSKVLSMGGGLITGTVCFLLLNSFVENPNVTKSDLENPPVAIEKIARNTLSSEPGFEYIKIETMGPDGDSYFVNISFHASSLMSDKGSFNNIRLMMLRTYCEILKHKELKIAHFKINAQLNMQDKFGNSDWSDAYRTELTPTTIQRLNRDNLDSVDFQKIWDEVYIHPVFWPYKDQE